VRRRAAIGLSALLTAGLGVGAVLGLNLVEEAAPTTTTEPKGPLYFRGDWEKDGEILGMPAPILGQYDGAQCENTKVTMDTPTFNRGRLYVVSDVVAKGGHAMRVDLEGDGLRTQACEALHGRKLGTGQGFPPFEEWYAFSIRFPANYTTRGWGLTLAQFNYQTIWGAPLYIQGNGPTETGEPNQLRLVGQAGECVPVTEPNPHCEWSSGQGSKIGPWRIIPPERFATEVWHDLLVHVIWSTNPAKGLIEGFHRQRGAAGALGQWANTVPALTGKPTVQWRPGTTVYPTNGTVDKIGAYRGPNATPLSIWHDNFCVAKTRAAAESCL
jgi:polysaccharide lyase-like protein